MQTNMVSTIQGWTKSTRHCATDHWTHIILYCACFSLFDKLNNKEVSESRLKCKQNVSSVSGKV